MPDMGDDMSDDPADTPQRAAANGTSGSAIDRILDRRTLLAAASGGVAARLGANVAHSSQAMAQPLQKARRIDAYSHISSLKFLDALEKAEGRTAAINAARSEEHTSELQ